MLLIIKSTDSGHGKGPLKKKTKSGGQLKRK